MSIIEKFIFLKKAKRIAKKAHKNQRDKGGHPYINHPKTMAKRIGFIDGKIVAWLHDVVEDTDVKLEDLNCFPSHIVTAVDAITKRKSESNKEYLERVKQNSLARYVKIQDTIHNMDLSRIRYIGEADVSRCKMYVKNIEFLLID